MMTGEKGENMERYGIWKITLVSVSGEVVIGEITARSGKDARARAESLLQILSGEVVICEITARSGKDARARAESLLQILADNGPFSGQDEAPSDDD